MEEPSKNGNRLSLKMNEAMELKMIPSPRSHASVRSQSLSLVTNNTVDPLAIAPSSPTTSCSSSSSISTSSSITSDGSHGHDTSSSTEETSMILGGCTRCLMYVMLHKNNPRCPRCNTAALVNFFHG